MGSNRLRQLQFCLKMTLVGPWPLFDTIAGLLNVMGEEGRLIRLRKSEQKVLWSLGEDGNRKRIKCQEKPPKTGSRF